MAIRFRTSFRVETRQTARPRGVALLAGFVLLTGAVILLWLDRGFGEYAATGILWDQAEGIVIDATNNSVPTIEFTTPDGARNEFKEDYILMCGSRRSFCWIRNFTRGERIPVVYNPDHPARAYVHDWALYGSVLGFFLDLIVALLLALMVFTALKRKPIQATVEFGDNAA